MGKHTPGPWFTHREGYSTVYIEARSGGGVLQEVAACGPTKAGPEQQEANARLIAAAQAMYAFIEQEANGGNVEAIAILEAINGRA